MRTIVTVTGVRPDFIRMSAIFKLLDVNPKINHIQIHSGQHYDKKLSDVFFDELSIRQPDYHLKLGAPGKEHFHLSAELSVGLIELFRTEKINPDLVVFLGDSNSTVSAVALKKEGYKIAHVEAGMRSGDKNMLEEINRTVCDHCSDLHFVYHPNYKTNLTRENLPAENIHVVGCTMTEIAQIYVEKLSQQPKKKSHILIDIHRPENFKSPERTINIFDICDKLQKHYNIPAYLLSFGRALKYFEEHNIKIPDSIKPIPLMSFNEYLESTYDAKFLISDSGSAQEEPAFFRTPVLVPRDFTERPESIEAECSLQLNVNMVNESVEKSIEWIDKTPKMDLEWMGDGNTARKIVDIMEQYLNEL